MVSDAFPPQTQGGPYETPMAVDAFPSPAQGGQQGRLSQAAVLGGMDPASDQMMGAPRPMMMPQPAGMRYRQPMTYGGKGGYYR